MVLDYFFSRILVEYICSVFQSNCEDNIEDVVFNPFMNILSAFTNMFSALTVAVVVY
jgi:hypothetical protein